LDSNEDFKEKKFTFRALREKDDDQSRIRTISVLAVLLQGPFDTGNAILGSQNLVDLMIQMAASDDPLQQVINLQSLISILCFSY
jgi:hypothetical protein